MSKVTAAKMVRILKGEEGYCEKASLAGLDEKTANAGSGNITKYWRDLAAAGYYQANKQGAEWCDGFYDWCLLQSCDGDAAKAQAMQFQTGTLYGAGCPFSRGYYRDHGRLYSTPEPGDQAFFQQGGNIVHTGGVIEVDATTVTICEGNKGNQVRICTYSRWDPYIADYGRPLWEDEEEEDEEPVLTSPAPAAASAKVLTVPALGVDVSTWQGAIDWEKAKADGVTFAMIRAGYGAGNVDQQFKRNALAAVKAGIYVGYYWFSYAYTADMARAEADYLIDAVKSLGLPTMFPLAFDYEYDSDIKAKQKGYSPDIVKLGDAFLAEIEARGGYAINYTNYDYWNRGFYKLTQFDLWLAQWGVSAPGKACGIWQYKSTGRVAGIDGNADMDMAYKDYPEIMQRTGLNNLTDEQRAAIVVPVIEHPYGWASRTTGYVRYGKVHDGVKAIQYALQELGFDIGRWGIDGEYGADTQTAVRNFQEKYGLEKDGVVGDETRGKFAELGY